MLYDQIRALRAQTEKRLQDIETELAELARTIQSGLDLQRDLLTERDQLRSAFNSGNTVVLSAPVTAAVPPLKETVPTPKDSGTPPSTGPSVNGNETTPLPKLTLNHLGNPATRWGGLSLGTRAADFIHSRKTPFTEAEFLQHITQGVTPHPAQSTFCSLFLQGRLRVGEITEVSPGTYLTKYAPPPAFTSSPSPVAITTTVTTKRSRKLGPVSRHGDYPPGVSATTRKLLDHLRQTFPTTDIVLSDVEKWCALEGVKSASSAGLRGLVTHVLSDLVTRGCLTRVKLGVYRVCDYRGYKVPTATQTVAPTPEATTATVELKPTLEDFMSKFPTLIEVNSPLSQFNQRVMREIQLNPGVSQQRLRDIFYPGDNELRMEPRDSLPTGDWQKLEQRRWSINSAIQCLHRHGLININFGSYYPVGTSQNTPA